VDEEMEEYCLVVVETRVILCLASWTLQFSEEPALLRLSTNWSHRRYERDWLVM
jgi:hypothetical protein